MHYHGEFIHTTPEEFHAVVVRALTKRTPVSEEETLIQRFIARWPEYTGGWLLMHFGLLKRHSTDPEYANASLFIRADYNASWMDVYVKGLNIPAAPGFNDWFIRRQQFICFHFLKPDDNFDLY